MRRRGRARLEGLDGLLGESWDDQKEREAQSEEYSEWRYTRSCTGILAVNAAKHRRV
jgi:hypothetical protein